MNYPFIFKVLLYDHDEGKYSLLHGCSFADSFADAADILESRFQEDLIAIKHLELLEEDSLFPITEDTFNLMKKAEFLDVELQIPCNEDAVPISKN